MTIQETPVPDQAPTSEATAELLPNPDQLPQELLIPEAIANSRAPVPAPKKFPKPAPMRWKTHQELQALVDAYFERETTWTMSGLALALNTSRATLLDYKGRNGYAHIINTAKAKIEEFVEKKLLERGLSPAGPIFNLCNNYKNWHQKQEQDLNIGGQANNPIRINVNFTNVIAGASVNNPSLLDASVNEPGTQD
jgi:hypothetical protein